MASIFGSKSKYFMTMSIPPQGEPPIKRLVEKNRSSSSLKRIYFVNTITVIRKEDKSREAGAIESDAVEEIGRNIIVEVKKKAEEGLDDSKTVIVEDGSRDIKQNEPDDRMYEETKEVEDAEMESEESEEKIKEEIEEEEEDDSEYFDTFPTIEELDTTSVINHYLRGMVLGKPFMKETGLVYNKEEGTVIFEKGKEKVIFKMPHKMERFKHIDFEEMKIDCIPPIVIEANDDDHEKTYYSDSLNLGPHV
ncbi:hypothetical protein Tco_0524161 [Tanacetum coccineum]